MADARTETLGDGDGAGDDGRFADLLVRTLPEPVGVADVRAGVERRVARRRRRRAAGRAGIAVVAVVALAGGATAALRTDDGPSVVAVTDDPATTAAPPTTDAAPTTEPVPTTGAVATTAPTTTSAVGTDDAACRGAEPVAGTAVYVAMYCGGTGMVDDPMTIVTLSDGIGTLQERMVASLSVLGASELLEDVPGRRTAFAAGFLLPATTVVVDDAGAVTIDLAVDLAAVPNATTSNVAGTLNRQIVATFFAYPEATSVTIGGQCIGDAVCPFTQTRAEWDATEAIRTAETIPTDAHELAELQQRLEEEQRRQEAEASARAAAEAREAAARAATTQGATTTSG
jgi:hypothetical protein